MRGTKLAPVTFKGKYSKVTRFIQHYNRLLEQYQVVSEADKCKGVLEYCSQTVQDFIQSNIHFSVPNWTRLQAEILNAYDADRLESRVRPADLVDFINQNSIQTMSNLTQWKKYYREYKARAGFLKMKGQLTDLQYNGYFWYGIPNQVRSILEEKLFARYPNYDTTDPWPVENVTTLAETYFKRDRFTEKLLPLPVYGLNHKEDEDSDDESEEAYDSEDSDYERERRKKRKQEKKKKKKSRAHLQKGPQTQIMEEEPSRRIIPPPEETDISGIIHQLNTMSLEDPRYGQLYYQAVKKDKGGLVAQCIRRKPLQESFSRAQDRDPPSHPSRANTQPYPRGIFPNPLRNQAPSNQKCYGCFKQDHILRDCPQMAILVNRGIVRLNPENFKYYLADTGQPLFRRPDECLMDTVGRMKPAALNTVQYISLTSEVENFYAQHKDFSEEESDCSSDSEEDSDDDGMRLNWTKAKARFPAYAAYEDDPEEEPQYYQSYPVERNTRTTRQARDATMKAPVKTKFDGVYPPSRKTQLPGPLPGIAPENPKHERQSSRRQEVTKAKAPEVPAVAEPIPVDARKPRVTEIPDIVMKDPEPRREKKPITLKDLPAPVKPAIDDKANNANKENQRPGPRQSELSHQVEAKKVVEEILDTQVSLPLKKILGSSKELSISFQDMLKFKNPPYKNSGSTAHFVAEAVFNSAIKDEDEDAIIDLPERDLEQSGNGLKGDKVLIQLTLSCQGRPITAVIDTGSQVNLISRSTASQLIRLPIDLSNGVYMTDANGGKAYLDGLIKDVPLTCGAVTTSTDLYVGENFPFDLLLGRPWQRGNFVSIDERKE